MCPSFCSEVKFVLNSSKSRHQMAFVFSRLTNDLWCAVDIGRTNGLYDMISIRRCNIAHISRYTGEHRGEIQGSNAIHEILKERIAFLSGIHGKVIILCFRIVTIGDM